MQKMYTMLCLFGLMAGCEQASPLPATEAEMAVYEKRLATSIPASGGMSGFQLQIVCLQGVQYYHRTLTHTSYLTPVFLPNQSRPEVCK